MKNRTVIRSRFRKATEIKKSFWNITKETNMKMALKKSK